MATKWLRAPAWMVLYWLVLMFVCGFALGMVAREHGWRLW